LYLFAIPSAPIIESHSYSFGLQKQTDSGHFFERYIDKEISDNLLGFLTDHIVAQERDLAEIEKDFSQARMPEDPQFVSDYTDFVMDKLVAHSVHTAAPGFIGHMATPLPYFMLPLSRIMVALNQNLVKIETSKAFTPLERQVLGMLHGIVYDQQEDFYAENLHNSRRALGSFCSGGTTANITALWVARNQMFPITDDFSGLAKAGIGGALQQHGLKGLAILVSERGHYSLGKAADVLGIGRENVISIETDANSRLKISALKAKCEELTGAGIGKPVASTHSRKWLKLPSNTRPTFMSTPPGVAQP